MKITRATVGLCSLGVAILAGVGSGTYAADNALEPRDPATGRIAGPPVDKWTEEQKATYKALVPGTPGAEARKPSGSVYMLLNHPEMATAWIRYGETVREKAKFRRGIRELIIVLSARKWNRDANWGHAQMAITEGKISPAIIEDIKNGVRPKFENEDERVAYDFYNELTANQAVSDKTYQQAWKTFGTSGLLDLTLLIGVYESSGIFGAAHRIEADKPQLPVLLFQRGEEPKGKAR